MVHEDGSGGLSDSALSDLRAARTTTTNDTGETVDVDREELRRLEDELQAREPATQQQDAQIEQQRREETITQREPQTAQGDTAVSDQRAQRDPGTGVGGGPISDTGQSTDPTTTTMGSMLDTADAQLDTVVSDLQVDADQTVEQALQTGEDVLREQATRLRASARERLSTVPGDRRADPDVPAAEEPAGNILSRFREGFEQGLAGERPRDIGESDEVFGFPTEVPERIDPSLGLTQTEGDVEPVEVPEQTPTGLPFAGAELEEIGQAQSRGAFEFGEQVAPEIVDLAIEGPPGPVPGPSAPIAEIPGGREAATRTLTGAIGGIAGIPGGVLTLGEESAEAAQALEQDEASPQELARGLGRATGGGVRSGVENPFLTAGAVGSGFVTGSATSRLVRGVPGRARAARIRSRGGRIVDFEDVSDPPREISGDLPAFSRQAEADPDVARSEFIEQAEATDIAGDEPVAFHARGSEAVSEFGGFGERFEAPEGSSELPGLFQSADLSPLRIEGAGESGSGFTLGIPRPQLRSSRILAERDIDVGITEGRTRGEVGEFIESEADGGRSFIRTDEEGGPTPEQEVVAPPGSEFVDEGGLFGVRVGGDVIPGRLTRRTSDVDLDDIRRGDAEGEVFTRREVAEETRTAISESLRRRNQPDRITPISRDVDVSLSRPRSDTTDGSGPTSVPDGRTRPRDADDRSGPGPTSDRRGPDDRDRGGPGPPDDRTPPPPPVSDPPPPPTRETPPPPPTFPFIPGGQQPPRDPELEPRRAQREEDDDEPGPAGQQFRNPIQSALSGLFGAVATVQSQGAERSQRQSDDRDDDPFGVFL